MTRVAHIPAHKALDLDNFHDAVVKVGLYKDPVVAIMHPYTLGALEIRARQMGGVLSTDGVRRIHFAEIVTLPFWSKDDVTFCAGLDATAAYKDAIIRGALTEVAYKEHRRAELEANGNDPKSLSEGLAARVDRDREWAEIVFNANAAQVEDVTGELEMNRTKKTGSDGKTVLVRKSGGLYGPYSHWFSTTLSPLYGEVSKLVTKWYEAAKEHHDDPETYIARELFLMAQGIGGKERMKAMAANYLDFLDREEAKAAAKT